ncbi:DinB family protein [Sutcliffiella horikoshii]|uniref:DinB family protein n=1 Tax=Sutcliffiella horikoshii TaxID=79883 RepID=A0A5D4T698_9BACI|nr:DinB family protein [Sutcliffiella horikoshii]TYS70431.1 DinB family protein [Sutcliffiella horikoshii]
MNLTISSYQAYLNNMEFFYSFTNKEESELNQPINYGKWSIKETIGHIYYWDLFLLKKMIPVMKDNGVLPEFPDHDEYNNKAMNAIKSFSSTNDLLEEFVITRKKLISNMERLNQEVRFTIGNNKRNYTPQSFLHMFVEHDVHHMEQIRHFTD